MNAITECIAAVSTPPGKGGVAVIRLSGDGAFGIAEAAFMPIGRRRLSDIAPRYAAYGHIVDGGERIDDVILTKYPAPNSYTGEDTAEISCHGGILVTRRILELLFRLGARPAEAGEFTRRAFINGKLTLTDAEAIGNLLDAKSDEQLKLASGEARTLLSEKIENIRASITDLISSIYARIDYPDEDLGDFGDEELAARLDGICETLSLLISTYRTGRAINEGISAVLCGRPNVGKSSVYNAILGEDAAIVTDAPGTTRDVLERTVPLGRVLLHLYDTAGVRGESSDRIELIGIERSEKKIRDAELIIAVFDSSEPLCDDDFALIRLVEREGGVKIALLNKSDVSGDSPAFDEAMLSERGFKTLSVSAKDGDRLTSALGELVNRLFTDELIAPKSDAIVSSARQHAALTRALDFLTLAAEGLKLGFMQDAVSSDIERALGAIMECDGRAVNDEVVGDIFKKFCVGK